jgi:hypothetical protein
VLLELSSQDISTCAWLVRARFEPGFTLALKGCCRNQISDLVLPLTCHSLSKQVRVLDLRESSPEHRSTFRFLLGGNHFPGIAATIYADVAV